MKSVIIAFLLVSQVVTQTHWFDIGPGAAKPLQSFGIAGPNQEYVVQGQPNTFNLYSIDWEAGSATEVNEISLTADSNLVVNSRVETPGSYNAILTSQTVARFNVQPGAPTNQEIYSVPTEANNFYAYPQYVHNTVYLFVSTLNFASTFKFYRLEADRITDVKEFTVTTNSRAYGAIHATNQVIISETSTNKRTIYDYTNGFVGGTDTILGQHTKTGADFELGFMLPEDGRDYYVVAAMSTKNCHTVKASDGSSHVTVDLSSFVDHLIANLEWVYDTDFALAASHRQKISIFDFMDTNQGRTPTSVDTPGGDNYHGRIWLEKRALAVNGHSTNLVYIFKIPVADQPCSDLCGTCHEIHRKLCTSCSAGASPTSPGATTCSCHDGYYQADLSFSRKQCLACSTLCATCSGGPR